MLVSCICVCHNKPDITHEALESILNQSYPQWEALIVDSGVLYDAGYYAQFAWHRDPRVKLIRSAETDEIRRSKAMAPWCFNECFRKGLVLGDLVVYLCDDDILYGNAFATFVSYCQQNRHAKAMYASQDIAVIYPNGWHAIIGERRATQMGGKSCHGRRMDCHVDYLQFCHKADVLKLLAPYEYWPESKDSESHADGIFMEQIGEHVPIYPIDVKVSQNRRTLRSTNVRVSSFTMIECMANGIPRVREAQAFPAPSLPPSYRWPSFGLNHAGPQREREDSSHQIIVASRPKRTASVLEDTPLVTISVPFCNSSSCLPDTLASVAEQTYPNLEVLVIDNCYTDHDSERVFEATRSMFPHFRFLRTGAGSSAARDRGLWEARGVYFIPMDADTFACPDMVERLVAGMRRNPDLSAMTCYVLALSDPPGRECEGCHAFAAGRSPQRKTKEPEPRKHGTPDLSPGMDAAASAAAEKPYVLASTKNVYGSGIFHAADFRNVDGYGTDSWMPGQDWIGFLRLVNAGYQVDIIPEHLFCYRLRENGSVRTRDESPNHERFLRPFFHADRLLAAERDALWTAFAGMQRRLEQLAEENRTLQEQNQALQTRCDSLRYQVADRLALLCARVPLARQCVQSLLCAKRQGSGP